MKKKVLFIVVLCCLFVLCGCSEKVYEYNRIERDAYNTGGNLSFEYDEYSHTAYFGGEGQVLEWYDADIAKGWGEAGNRIGIKIVLPYGVDDYKSATAVVGEEKMEYKDFIFGEENKCAIFQPLVDKDNSQITLKIKWQDSAEEQNYLVVVRTGTIFMPSK